MSINATWQKHEFAVMPSESLALMAPVNSVKYLLYTSIKATQVL